MNTTLFVNFLVYLILYYSKYAHSEDILLGSEFSTADSEPQIPNSKSEKLESYTFPNVQNSVHDNKNSKLDINFSSSFTPKFPDELRFFTLIPDGQRKVKELTRDKYTFNVDENNHEIYHYEFSDNNICAKIKYDDSTIWRSGDYSIDGVKYVIYYKNNDRIVVRDDERSITYRLVDDSPDNEENLETASSEPDLTDTNTLKPLDSAVTYVAYLTDHAKDFRRSSGRIASLIIFLIGLLVLMTLMLIGLLLLVVRVHKAVDQVKFNVERNETKVVL